MLYFFYIQTHALWQGPTLIADRWKQVFYPIANLFPEAWVRLYRGSDLGYLAVVLYFLLLALFFVPYVLVMKRAFRPGAFTEAQRGKALRRILLFSVLALAVLMIVPGTMSSDLFSYIWYGRIFVVFGDNPFVHVPADYAWKDVGDWLQWTYWKETPSVYGPVWVMFAGFIAAVSQALGGDITNYILGNKLLASLGHLANIVLTWHIAGIVVRHWWRRPGSLSAGVTEQDWRAGAQIGATLVYAWNPLAVLEFGANGHNDVLMTTGVLTAILLYLKGHWRWAMVAFGAAAMVKFIAVIFVPGFVWLLFWEAAPGSIFRALPRRLWRAAQAVGILALTCALSYIPFWAGPQTLNALASGPPFEMYVNSLGWLLRYKLPDGLHNLALLITSQPSDFWSVDAIGRRLDWPTRFGAGAIMAAFALVQTWRARTFPGMVVAWGWILFVYVTIGAVWFWPWYVAWILIPAAMIGPGRLLKATAILSGTSMMLYGTYWHSNHVIAEIQSWKPLLIFVPPFAYLVVSAWRDATLQRRITDLLPLPRPKPRPRLRPEPIPALPRAVRVPAVPTMPRRVRTYPPGAPEDYVRAGGASDPVPAGEPLDY